MKEYDKVVGCRVEPYVIEFIRKKNISQSEYLRRLILEDIKRSKNNANKVVNSHVNNMESKDEALDIHEKVDRILKHFNIF